MIGMPHGTGEIQGDRTFPEAAHDTLQDGQLRRNLGHALSTIRAKRLLRVAELPDWEELREAASQIKAQVMGRLPEFLEQLEAAVVAGGGQVHWARDSGEACEI